MTTIDNRADLDNFPEHVRPYLIPEYSGDCVYECIACTYNSPLDRFLYTCPECGNQFGPAAKDDEFWLPRSTKVTCCPKCYRRYHDRHPGALCPHCHGEELVAARSYSCLVILICLVATTIAVVYVSARYETLVDWFLSR